MKALSTTSPAKRPRNRTLRGVAALALAGGVGMAAGTQWVDAKTRQSSPLENMSPQVQRAVSSANDLSTAFRVISEAVLPAVVSIENRPDLAANSAASMHQPSAGNAGDVLHLPAQDFGGRNPFEGTPFEDFFKDDFGFRGFPDGRMPRNPGVPRSPMPRGNRSGIGSGVIIDDAGVILTNNHVVEGGGTVVVRTADGREYTASEVLTDPSTDIAVVKIEGAENLTAAVLGDSETAEVGDWVLALGQPFGLESTVTAGIISAKHRGIGINDRENYLQTDAAINPGNSGGPLVNLRGEIIGVNTAISSRGGGNDGIGFAVPSNMVKWVTDQLLEEGKVRRAYLGIGIQPVNAELGKSLGVPPRSGVVVTEVMDGTPAADTGLESGDVIIRFGGQAVNSPAQLQLLVERSVFGSSVDVVVNRGGDEVTLKYVPTERPDEFGKRKPKTSDKEEAPEATEFDKLGLELNDLTEDTASALGLKSTEGVVVTSVADNSPAARAGLTPGVVITQVARENIAGVEEFRRIVESNQGDLLCLVKDERSTRYVVLKRS